MRRNQDRYMKHSRSQLTRVRALEEGWDQAGHEAPICDPKELNLNIVQFNSIQFKFFEKYKFTKEKSYYKNTCYS